MADIDPEVKEEVREILKQHRGRDNPVSSRELSDKYDIDSINSFPNTRAIIRELLVEEKMPIGACNEGYFMIETEEEFEQYLGNLETRKLRIEDRIQAVYKAVINSTDIIDDDVNIEEEYIIN